MTPPHLRSRLARAGLALLLAIGMLTGAVPAAAAVRPPSTPAGLPSAIEPLAPYVGETSCDPVVKAGTYRLARLLVSTYRGTSFSTVYACGTDGTISEHYEGRAIDWMVSIRNRAQLADAQAVIAWLLATDRQGNKFANARRLGVMYLIYNNRIWGSWNGAWAPYLNCAKTPQPGLDSMCHRNHMHLSLSWNGALGATSFWTKRVSATDWGPCRPRDLNWATPRTRSNPTPCPDFATVGAPAHASAVKVALVRYSGSLLRPGSTGPAVAAVQRAFHASATGVYTATLAATVAAFNRSRRVPGGGAVIPATWRALLAAVR